MSLSEILKQDAKGMYRATEGLFRKVDDLDWKPTTGRNWMTTGQLSYYLKLQGEDLNTFDLWMGGG